jgi:hypothetical protein
MCVVVCSLVAQQGEEPPVHGVPAEVGHGTSSQKARPRTGKCTGEAVVCACDRPSDLSCVLLYMQHEGISVKEQAKQAKKKRDRK